MKNLSWRKLLPTSRTLVVAPTFLWMILFLLVPFLLVLKISFADLFCCSATICTWRLTSAR